MASELDLTALGYFIPLLSYLVVSLIVFVVFQKAKILDGKVGLQVFFSMVIGTIFVSFAGAREYVTNIVPWFVVLTVCLFFILAIIGFAGDKLSGIAKPIGIGFIVLLILGFLVSAIFVFSSELSPYLPGGSGGDRPINNFTEWIYSSRVMGAILLLAVSAIVAFVLVKSK
jgi:hypothetical protein